MNRRGTRRAGPGLSPIQGAALSVRVRPGAQKGPQHSVSLEPNERKFLSLILEPRYTEVENKIFTIMGRSLSSMIRTQGIGNMYEIYLMAKRDDLAYHLAYIPGSFTDESNEAFDPVYMKRLFDLAFETAKDGYPWEKVPPGYDLEAELE